MQISEDSGLGTLLVQLGECAMAAIMNLDAQVFLNEEESNRRSALFEGDTSANATYRGLAVSKPMLAALVDTREMAQEEDALVSKVSQSVRSSFRIEVLYMYCSVE